MSKPLTELTPAEIRRAEWGHVHGVLVEARRKLEAEYGGVQSWMTAAIDIAHDRAIERLPFELASPWRVLSTLTMDGDLVPYEIQAAAEIDGIGVIARWKREPDGTWSCWAVDTEQGEEVVECNEEDGDCVPTTPPFVGGAPPAKGRAALGSAHVCSPVDGCRGTGAHPDATDSGSGREVYCDCLAGRALRERERAAAPATIVPATPAPRCEVGTCDGSGVYQDVGEDIFCECPAGFAVLERELEVGNREILAAREAARRRRLERLGGQVRAALAQLTEARAAAADPDCVDRHGAHRFVVEVAHVEAALGVVDELVKMMDVKLDRLGKLGRMLGA